MLFGKTDPEPLLNLIINIPVMIPQPCINRFTISPVAAQCSQKYIRRKSVCCKVNPAFHNPGIGGPVQAREGFTHIHASFFTVL